MGETLFVVMIGVIVIASALCGAGIAWWVLREMRWDFNDIADSTVKLNNSLTRSSEKVQRRFEDFSTEKAEPARFVPDRVAEATEHEDVDDDEDETTYLERHHYEPTDDVVRPPDADPGPRDADAELSSMLKAVAAEKPSPAVFEYLHNPNTDMIHLTECSWVSEGCQPMWPMGETELRQLAFFDGYLPCRKCTPFEATDEQRQKLQQVRRTRKRSRFSVLKAGSLPAPMIKEYVP